MIRFFKIISLIIVLINSFLTFSQQKTKVPNLPNIDEKPLYFGFLLGFNTMDFKVLNSGIENTINNNIATYGDVINLQSGINIGIVSNFHIKESWDFRFLPGIAFGQRDLLFRNGAGNLNEGRPLEIKSTFLEFPFLLKYSSKRSMNFRPYLIGGANFRYDLAKSKKDKIVLKPFDIYGEIGGGVEFYLAYFKLALELKASYGLLNVLDKKGTGDEVDLVYTQGLSSLFSNIFHFTFYFEGDAK